MTATQHGGNVPARSAKWEACTCGKRSYPSRAAAKTVRRRVEQNGLHVYQCPESGGWHLGHTRPGRPRSSYPQRTTEEANRG